MAGKTGSMKRKMKKRKRDEKEKRKNIFTS